MQIFLEPLQPEEFNCKSTKGPGWLGTSFIRRSMPPTKYPRLPRRTAIADNRHQFRHIRPFGRENRPTRLPIMEAIFARAKYKAKLLTHSQSSCIAVLRRINMPNACASRAQTHAARIQPDSRHFHHPPPRQAKQASLLQTHTQHHAPLIQRKCHRVYLIDEDNLLFSSGQRLSPPMNSYPPMSSLITADGHSPSSPRSSRLLTRITVLEGALEAATGLQLLNKEDFKDSRRSILPPKQPL